jgi:hypothetical protein
MLLLSKEPLMKRCLSTGGAVLLFKPIPEAAAEASYQKVIEAFGLINKSPEDRIKSLLTLPVDDLWQKVPVTVPLLPSVDGETVPGEPNFITVSSQEDDPKFEIPGRKWCAALMIGEAQLDVSVGRENQPSATDNDIGKHLSLDRLRWKKPRDRSEVC